MGETRRNFDRGLILRSDTMPELYARLLTLASEPPEDEDLSEQTWTLLARRMAGPAAAIVASRPGVQA
jgi:hypothetical protein